MLVIEKERKVDLVMKYIDIFSALHVPEEKWLTKREKEYLVANIILNANGVDLSSRRASLYLEETCGFINRGVSVYRSKLKEKGWIVQTALGIDLIKAFDFSKTGIPLETTFNVKVKLKEDKSEKANG